jgi:hypothetical protein
MALIVETGSVVANANTFVTRAELIAYAALRGVTVTDTEASDIPLVRAADYLLYRESEMKGARTSMLQTLPYPRTGVEIGVYVVGSNEIPDALKRAQLQIAMEVLSGVDVLPTKQAAQFVTMKKLGPIETQYSEAVALQGQVLPLMPLVDAALAPLLAYGSGALRAYRA